MEVRHEMVECLSCDIYTGNNPSCGGYKVDFKIIIKVAPDTDSGHKPMSNNKNLLPKLSVTEYVENVKSAMEQLETMEMGNEKLERYKEVKALLKQNNDAAIKVFMLRGLLAIVLFAIFIITIILTGNRTVQIIVFVVIAILGICLISPMLPSPFVPYQDKLRKMMKKDGVKYRDCSIISK